MATTDRKPFDWNDPKNFKERAWNSVKEFFGKEDDEHPISPEMVAKEMQGAEGSDAPPESEESNADRLHRRTEQRALNDNPTIWPG